MGPINWLAVVLAAVVALVLRLAWQAGGARVGVDRRLGLAGVVPVMALASVMLGHNYARLAGVLAAKPWLYWMQSGGLAIAFVVPALWLALAQGGVSRKARASEAGFWVVAYLAMGTVFWALSGTV